jgi:hypothetical protein
MRRMGGVPVAPSEPGAAAKEFAADFDGDG